MFGVFLVFTTIIALAAALFAWVDYNVDWEDYDYPNYDLDDEDL